MLCRMLVITLTRPLLTAFQRTGVAIATRKTPLVIEPSTEISMYTKAWMATLLYVPKNSSRSPDACPLVTVC